MTKKQLRDIAIVVIIIFAITIVVYPLLFGTDVKPNKASTPSTEMAPTPPAPTGAPTAAPPPEVPGATEPAAK